ncbi:hypothetical protein AAG906_011499 [Vitis piasezkii]
MEVEMGLSTHGMHKVFDSISEDCSGYCRNPILQVVGEAEVTRQTGAEGNTETAGLGGP